MSFGVGSTHKQIAKGRCKFNDSVGSGDAWQIFSLDENVSKYPNTF